MYMDRAKRIRLSRRWRIMIIIAAALTVLCVVCILAYGSVAHRLEAQREAERWHRFQADIEAVYLRPGASKLKWQ